MDFLEQVCAAIEKKLTDSRTANTLLCFMLPGISMGASLTRDPSSLYLLADAIPAASKVYSPSGHRISTEYQRILNAKLPLSPPLPAADQARLNAANAYILQNHRQYCDFVFQINTTLALYNIARRDHGPAEAQYREKLRTLRREGQNIIQLYEQQLQVAERLGGPTGWANKFRTVQTLFDLNRCYDGIYSVRFLPDVDAIPHELAWVNVELASQVRDAREISELGGSFSLRFQVSRIIITRDWLDLGLFACKDAYLSGMKKYSVSTGTLEGSRDCAMPLIPTELLLARNVEVIRTAYEISADPSPKKESLGPFLLKQAQMERFPTQNGKACCEKLTAPDVQIIAIRNILTPAFPHQSDPSIATNHNRLNAQDQNDTQEKK